MRIKEIYFQNRRDFNAIFECEHCGVETKLSGYGDEHFHKNVIPSFNCTKCGKSAPSTYRALTTKYPEGFHI